MTQQRSDSLESADSELAQCETEVSTLLQIISELNRKMDCLQIPREMKPPEGHVCVDGCVPQQGLRSSACSLTAADAGKVSVETKTKNICRDSEGTFCLCNASSSITNEMDGLGEKLGGSSDLWNDLQKVLSALETSSGHGRKMLRLQTQNSEIVQAHHLSAARESWVKATQVLEEMESDLGISYPSALPPDERRQYQRDVLSLYKHNQDLNTSLKSHQEELIEAESLLIDLEDEKKWLMEKLVDLKRKWLYGVSRSPPVSPSLSSSRTSSPSFSSPPYPGSPLLSRKLPGSRPDSPSSPCTVDSVLQAEIEKLQSHVRHLRVRALWSAQAQEMISSEAKIISDHFSASEEIISGACADQSARALRSLGCGCGYKRCLERLKARNERLNGALVRRKGESEQLSMSLSRQEADSSALHMALAYWCAAVFTSVSHCMSQKLPLIQDQGLDPLAYHDCF
ncbi:hypothetical protein F2P79_023603 [Pimephales promelas]|nr:hypothetical protein F2P79_023603 [Pimephales promelas]